MIAFHDEIIPNQLLKILFYLQLRIKIRLKFKIFMFCVRLYRGNASFFFIITKVDLLFEFAPLHKAIVFWRTLCNKSLYALILTS
jgi:hypothetical protein